MSDHKQFTEAYTHAEPRRFVHGYNPTPKNVLGACEPRDLSRFRAVRRLEVPASGDLTPFLVDIRDQGNEGSCVCFSGGAAIRIVDVREMAEQIAKQQGISLLQAAQIAKQTPPNWISPQLAYFFCRCLDGDPKEDAGTYCSTFWTVGSEYGYAHESDWPYVPGDLIPQAKRIPMLTRLAYRHRMVGYKTARITSTGAARVADIKAAIAAGYPVHFGGPVDNGYMNLGSGDVWPGCTGSALGGHARTWVKYDNATITEVGSYGVYFASHGLVPCSWDAVHQCDDLWIAETAPIV